MADERSIKLAAALNRETVNNNITWHVMDAPETLTIATNDIMQVIYWAKYKDKKMVIFSRQYRYYFDEDEWTWAEGLVLSIVSNDFKQIWADYEESQALRDLYKTVTKQASGFNDLLDDLLS
ncbi:hypothetical protein [Tatumella ptyseos]|uniref:hypothetical protein n=1 Tax=Tatumella ptyseos TaxID=82987 RepID=UPI0023F4BD91|nr:hypothetical protein [Tatumella ptyseos]